MKKLVLSLAVIAGMSFFACNSQKAEEAPAEEPAVEEVVEEVAVDSVAPDSVAEAVEVVEAAAE